MLIPSLAVFLFAITLTLLSIDLALILIFIPTKKISSPPPQLESGNLPIWPLDVPSPFPFEGSVLTPLFIVLISFVLFLFISSHTSSSIITFKTLVISMPLPFCLP
jgi:hypothetical protein